MSSITVYNKMDIDPRAINANNNAVSPGDVMALSFEEGETVIISMSNPNVQLTNGCWIEFPSYSNYEFIPEEPEELTSDIEDSIITLNMKNHNPGWDLHITNPRKKGGKKEIVPEPSQPNITVGDNQ